MEAILLYTVVAVGPIPDVEKTSGEKDWTLREADNLSRTVCPQPIVARAVPSGGAGGAVAPPSCDITQQFLWDPFMEICV